MNILLSEEEKIEIIQISESIPKEEILKYYTCSDTDLAAINKYRKDYNRLGFAIQLGILKHKGWQMSYINNIPNRVVLPIPSKRYVRRMEYLLKLFILTFLKYLKVTQCTCVTFGSLIYQRFTRV